MSMYSLLKNNQKPSKDEIEKSFDGNICRCTGYRAILQSMKTFASDENPIHDIEDLLNMKCLADQEPGSGCCSDDRKATCVTSGQQSWHLPTDLVDLIRTIRRMKESARRFKLVSGNTSVGVYKEEENIADFEHLINLRSVKELNRIEKNGESLTIGSVVTISDLVKTFEAISEEDEPSFGHLRSLAVNLRRVGSCHIRNIASWSGNLALKRKHPEFPSDVLVILESVGAKLNVLTFGDQSEKTGSLSMSLTEYLSNDTLDVHLIESMNLPRFDQAKVRIKVFKTSHRAQNSHSFVNCGFRFEIDSSRNIIIGRPLMIFNGLSSIFNRAPKTEQFLESKCLNDEAVFKQAVQLLIDEIESAGLCSDNPLLPPSKYRLNLAVSFFFKYIVSLNPSSVSKELTSAVQNIIDSRQASRGDQKFPKKDDLFPLTKPMSKLNAYSQASGETKYVYLIILFYCN